MTDQVVPAGSSDGSESPVPYSIRTYQPSDHEAVLDLYLHGRLVGRVNPALHTADLSDIEGYYLGRPQDHFWVAETGGRVIGTVGVAVLEEHIAHIRRLRVAADCQHTKLAFELIKTTLEFATDQGCLKIVLHTPVDEGYATELLGSLGFVYAGSKDTGRGHLLEFYLDLYKRAESTGRAPGDSLH